MEEGARESGGGEREGDGERERGEWSVSGGKPLQKGGETDQFERQPRQRR